MMKKKISLIIVIFILGLFININEVYAGTVKVNINGNSTVKVNNTIDVTIAVSDIVGFTDGLATAQGTLSFDNGYLEYQAYRKADSSPLSASYGTTTKKFVALGMSGEYIASSGDLITITFKAKQIGKTKISIGNLIVGDTKAIVHSATSLDKEIEIVGENSVITNPDNNDKGNNIKNTTTSKRTTSSSNVSNKSSNNNLDSLVINNSKVSPSFSPATTSYNVIVANGTTKLDLTYKTSDPKAKVEVVGNSEIKEGINNVVQVIVTAEDGTTKTYTLNVEVSPDKANNKLASLKIKESDLYPKFDSDVNEYNIKLKKDIKELTIDAIAVDENSKVEIIDNKDLDKNNSVVLIKVTDKNGLSNYYKLKINSNKGAVKLFGFPINYILIFLIILALLIFLLLLFFKRKKEDEEENEDDLYDDVVTKDELINAIEERDSKKLKMLLTQEEANRLKEEVRNAESVNVKKELIDAIQKKDNKKIKKIMEQESQNSNKTNSYDEIIKDELIDAIEERDTSKIKTILKHDEMVNQKKSSKR